MTAARDALAQGDVDLILPYVPAEAEAEVREAFDLVARTRAVGDGAQAVADRWFFETVVRLHRAGEGAPFTGLTPAGLDVGPVIPVAERALRSGSAAELADLLCDAVREQVETRHSHAMELGGYGRQSVPQVRAHVEAMLGLQVWAHQLYKQIFADPHAHASHHEHV